MFFFSGNVMTPGVYTSVATYTDWIEIKGVCQDSVTIEQCRDCHAWTSCDITGCEASRNGDPCEDRPNCDQCEHTYHCYYSFDLTLAQCSFPTTTTTSGAPTARFPTVTPTQIPSVTGYTPLPFVNGFIPPIGCQCVEAVHPHIGPITAYCAKRFGSLKKFLKRILLQNSNLITTSFSRDC